MGSVAFGPSPHADADGPSAGPSQPHEGEDPRETAKRSFDAGMAAIASGEFDLAVSSFERAHSMLPHPVTLFNLALALEKAKRLPEAWELFDDIIDTVESNAERREVRRHMRTIESKIAIVEVDAHPRKRLCIDGLDMPRGETSDYRLAVDPGRYDMLLDEHAFSVEFEAGDRRVLLLDRADNLVPSERGGVLLPAMAGTAIGTGALALVLGISAATTKDDLAQTSLAVGTATSAGLAVAASVVVLLLETRVIEDRTRSYPEGANRKTGTTCPGSPKLERRLDLQIGPTLDRPVEFSIAPSLQPRPTAVTASVPSEEFPHPHAIQPPRGRGRSL
ncbi:hypothetical protein DB30_08030 [Enhygromyxa salina]|uniref:Tetratricopeptide repeat protein n=1 Tax=Enhygromyxa salina TaxID=215803 RepID=A0A0C1Z750_9BACT|nr:tetratricopeptide repeat protein [Enhygromyxa salina]KIG13464.1 hypothetical protein DB30_08030 [Enhygromyxa salina]